MKDEKGVSSFSLDVVLMKTENKNFLFNVVYQFLIYIFPLITIPYLSRVLGVESIGIYSYTFSIVYVFMLVAMLGINTYGNRAIARVRDDKEQLSRTFFSIYFLQLIINSVVILIYIIFLYLTTSKYNLFFQMHLILLLSVCLDINWFYFGLEKFKITITRNIIVKIISTVLIFVLVKQEADLWKYMLIMGGQAFISQFYLVCILPKFVSFRMPKINEAFRHLKGCLILFIPVLAFSIYRVIDKIMLGAMSSVTELGYFENAERIINIPIAVISALGTVMLPRMSYLLRDGKSEYKKQIFESMKLALLLGTTMSLGLILIGKDAALIMFGLEFSKSGGIIMALSVTIIASAWANVVRTQFLIPKGKDKIYVYSTIGGAIINICSNVILIKHYGAYGACVGTILAEIFVAVYQSIMCRKDIEIKKYIVLLIEFLVKGVIIMIIAYIAAFKIQDVLLRLIIEVMVAAIAFIAIYFKFIFYDFFGKKQSDKFQLKKS